MQKKTLFKILSIFLMLAILFSFAGCKKSLKSRQKNSENSKTETSQTDSNSSSSSESKIKIGVVLARGGKGDKSFNDGVIRGLDKLKAEKGIEYKDTTPKEVSEQEKALENFAKSKYDLVIAVGFTMAEDLEKVAEKYPDTKFAIVDNVYEKIKPNVVCLAFKENEGSFLAGALAALMSKTNTVGFVGGQDIPIIHRFEGGFITGAKYAREDVNVLSNYVGPESTAFNDPTKAKEIAYDMVSKNADVIYHAAGGSGQGVFNVAAEKGIFAIGVDSNQNYIAPGSIISSMVKRVDVAVYNIGKSLVDKSFKGGVAVISGLKENGVGLTSLTDLEPEEKVGLSDGDVEKIKEMKKQIPQEVVAKIEEIKEKIINGEIEVPDWMKDGKPAQ